MAQFAWESKPDLLLPHHLFNPDHGAISPYVNMSQEAAAGQGPLCVKGMILIERTPILCFEPRASEISGSNPNIFIDILT